jgi:hypothetical protein
MVERAFATINEIDVQRPDSWQDRTFLTFDLDWANDAVIGFTLDLLESHGVPATVFVTHRTPLLDRMRRMSTLELGIHPNFNFLLQGDFRYGRTSAEVLEHFLAIVPEARSVRSHSLAISSTLLADMAARGLRWESNYFVPWSSGVELKPWLSWNQVITQVPLCWTDDIHSRSNGSWNVSVLPKMPGLNVLIFHPIHIFLNTERLARYDGARPFLADEYRLTEHVNRDGAGARTLLLELIG